MLKTRVYFTKYKYSKLATFISSLQGGIGLIAIPYTIVPVLLFPLFFLSMTVYLVAALILPIILIILISKINTDKIAEKAEKKYFKKLENKNKGD